MERFVELEERTLNFARDVKELINNATKSLTNTEISRQLMRAAGSVGANYIEANESASKKDFRYRIRLCKQEAKESRYWLRLMDGKPEKREVLIRESIELFRIFGSMFHKSNT